MASRQMARGPRVLHVIASAERRGAEVFAASLVSALAQRGVPQCVAVVRPGEEAGVVFDVETSTLCGGDRRLPGVRMDPRGVRALSRLAREFGPDVVQVHGGEPLKYALAALRGHGTRIVYRRIGDSAQFGGNALRRSVYAALMRRAARIVAVAEALRAELVQRYGVPAARVVAIPNAVDALRLAPRRGREQTRRSLGVPEGGKVVLSLGALTWEKDPLAHLRIVAHARRVHQHLVHVVAGDGPLRSEVEAAVARSGDNRTILLGSRGDVADLLAASDVLLLASRTEGMPACVIEAGMLGVPVAGYALSGVPEVVLDGVTGVLAPPGDAEGLASRLASLLDDGDARRSMGLAAVDRCRANFDIQAVAPRYLRVYEEVAEAI